MNEHISKIIQQSVNGQSDSEQLLCAIFGIALATRGKNFLELGVRGGDTTLPLLIASNYLGATLVSVDKNQHSFDCPQQLKNHWHFIQSDAIEFLRNNNAHYDLIFIDDWHECNHVQQELSLIEKFCTKSTIILLHDLMYNGSYPEYNLSDGEGEFANGGPFKAVNNLDKNMWEFATIPFSHGLTILRKK